MNSIINLLLTFLLANMRTLLFCVIAFGIPFLIGQLTSRRRMAIFFAGGYLGILKAISTITKLLAVPLPAEMVQLLLVVAWKVGYLVLAILIGVAMGAWGHWSRKFDRKTQVGMLLLSIVLPFVLLKTLVTWG